jgi:6-pyruvoyltetrahydropterin/6-carboxytetrahydropterin synthase
MKITKIFTFDSAHHLTNYNGKCEQMHGHTYKLEVTVEGSVKDNGLVIDFLKLKRIVKKEIIDELDHNLINNIIENPSVENIVVWIWGKLKDHPDFEGDVSLCKLVLWESSNSCVTYQG